MNWLIAYCVGACVYYVLITAITGKVGSFLEELLVLLLWPLLLLLTVLQIIARGLSR